MTKTDKLCRRCEDAMLIINDSIVECSSRDCNYRRVLDH